MPPSARISIVEFRSLLLPPVRVSLRALQSLYRPQCPSIGATAGRSPQCLAQHRNFCLYKTATARTTLGQHKVLPFNLYNVAPLGDSAHQVNLVRSHKGKEKMVAENISLEELYENHVKPGQLLYLRDPVLKTFAENVPRLKEANMQLQHRTFGVFETGTLPGNKKGPDTGKGPGSLKTTPISLSSPAAYFQLAMDRSYQFIELGSPVEFSIAIKRTKLPKEERITGAKDQDAWPWLHKHFPHLRPDFILRSMPEGSRWSVEPVTDGRHLHFVIVKPTKLNWTPENYTRRLFTVKQSVDRLIQEGGQQSLPAVLRQKLYDSGHNNYSPLTPMPVKQARPKEGEKIRSEYEEADNERTFLSNSRYMPDPKPPSTKARKDKLNKAGGLVRTKPGARQWLNGREADMEAARELQRQATRGLEDHGEEEKHLIGYTSEVQNLIDSVKSESAGPGGQGKDIATRSGLMPNKLKQPPIYRAGNHDNEKSDAGRLKWRNVGSDYEREADAKPRLNRWQHRGTKTAGRQGGTFGSRGGGFQKS